MQKQKRVLVGHVHHLEKDTTKIVHPLHTMHYKMSTSTKHPKRCQASQLSPHDAFWLLRADLGWQEEEEQEVGGAAALPREALTRDW